MNLVISQRTRDFFSKIIIYLIVLYTFFLLGKAVWTNFQLKKERDAIEGQIVALQEQNKNLSNLILYYQSDSFREEEAREKLGLKKPGETVVQVPVKKATDFGSEIAAQVQSVSEKTPPAQQPNWQLWWQYFFK
jgi:cell division protein FtsB